MTIIIPGVSADGSVVKAQLANDSVDATKIDFGTGSNQVDTDVLPEGSTNLYHTSERVDDRVNALLTAGSNITLTYDDAANTLTIAATEDNLANNSLFDLSDVTGTHGAGKLLVNTGSAFAAVDVDTDSITEGSSNLFHTTARAISAVEGEATLNLQKGVTVDTDISIGDWSYRNNTNLPATGLRIISPEDKVRWPMINLEGFGGNLADADDKPFNIHNPTISGIIHGGTQASPTAAATDQRTLSISGTARFGTSSGDIDTISQISMNTTEAQTSTNRGGNQIFRITPTTTTSMKDYLKVDAAGLNNLNIAYDPSGEFSFTNLSSQSTNGFQIGNNVKIDGNTTLGDANTDTVTVNAVMSIADTAGFKIGNISKATADALDAGGFVSKGGIALITDGSRANVPIFYDGSDWRYFSDSAVIAS